MLFSLVVSLSCLGIEVTSASQNDLAVFLLMFGRVCVELVISTLKWWVELASEAIGTWSSLPGQFLITNSVSSYVTGLFTLFLFETVLVGWVFIGPFRFLVFGYLFCFHLFLHLSSD